MNLFQFHKKYGSTFVRILANAVKMKISPLKPQILQKFTTFTKFIAKTCKRFGFLIHASAKGFLIQQSLAINLTFASTTTWKTVGEIKQLYQVQSWVTVSGIHQDIDWTPPNKTYFFHAIILKWLKMHMDGTQTGTLLKLELKQALFMDIQTFRTMR